MTGRSLLSQVSPLLYRTEQRRLLSWARCGTASLGSCTTSFLLRRHTTHYPSLSDRGCLRERCVAGWLYGVIHDIVVLYILTVGEQKDPKGGSMECEIFKIVTYNLCVDLQHWRFVAIITCKQLTKTLGSKRPAVDWLIVVYCSSVNFATISTQLWTSTAS